MAKKQIAVQYIDHMGSDKRVVNVARTSFGKWEDESNPLTERDIGLLNYLSTGVPKDQRDDFEAMYKASTHFAPFAHCFLSVRCSVPVFLARQLVKHQIGLVWSEESRRYIDSPVDYWLPDVIHLRPEGSIKQGSGEIHPQSTEYLERIESSTLQNLALYREAIEDGVAPEEARIVLPLNAMVNFVWTGSLLAWIRVIKQRQSSHAQKAAEEFAGLLRPILEQHFPESVKAYERSFEK